MNVIVRTQITAKEKQKLIERLERMDGLTWRQTGLAKLFFEFYDRIEALEESVRKIEKEISSRS